MVQIFHKKGFWPRLLSLVLAVMFIALPVSAAEKSPPSRVINVVYDDSGSMIKTGGQLVDTWCQAKYAMEVFAALLGTNDTLNIYVMSDFDGRQGSARLSLAGSDGQTANVAKIHEMVTKAGNTPFDTVRKAYADLEASQADEKWLVVLTDGEFQGVDDVNGFFVQKSPEIKVMFLGMGPNAEEIMQNQSFGIYFEKAATSTEILSKITGICTRIFNSNRLEVNVSAKSVDFDIPMSELVVFAQGENVSIGGIVDSGGKTYLSSMSPVEVRYSEVPATNYSSFIMDRTLKGSILTFKDDFPAGSYSLDVSGANTIEVYYKPNVEIAAYLTDKSGAEVTDLNSLPAGEYTISFGFVKAGTHERLNQSALLGEVSYSAYVTNNGVTHDRAYSSGDSISIEEGTLEIDATAQYLDYNSVSTHIDFSIFQDKPVAFSFVDQPAYEITKDGMDAAVPIQIKVTVDGKEVSAADWASMELPTVSLSEADALRGYGDFTVEKSDAPGIYLIYPSLEDKPLSSEIYEDYALHIDYESKYGDATWSGSEDGAVKVSDTRSWLERNLRRIIKWIICGAIVILLLGYVPPFKKYLPKRLKKRPAIDCSPNRPGVHQMTASGHFTKKIMSTLIPYKAQEGSIKFMPPGVPGVAVLQVRAAGGNAMMVTNIKAYAGKNNITFNGSPVPEGTTKPMRLSSGAMISVNTKEMTYTCVPSNK